MANDLLIAAIHRAGLTNNDVADVAQVDPKTVERWISGRVPHPRYRSVLANHLVVDEAELWPDTARARGRRGLEEITGAWARRDEKDAPDWRALFRGAEQHVDLIGYSLLSVIEARGALKALAGKAADGCQIRIAVADPDADHVLAADLRQRPAGRLAARIRTSQERLLTLAGQPGIELRQHQVASSHTILRFDDELLLTIHLAATPGLHAPLLHLHRERDYGIFDQLARHVEDVWETARPLHGAAGETAAAPPAKPEPSGADQLLDKLDNVWRPGR